MSLEDAVAPHNVANLRIDRDPDVWVSDARPI